MSHPTQNLDVIMTAHTDCPDCLSLVDSISDPSGGIAETTTTMSDPRRRARTTRCATARIRSGVPTEVPPYF